MKKLMMASALGLMLTISFTSCEQNEDPKYKDPTTFTVNTPALQQQVLQTNGDLTSNETFNLFCSQPDYGFAAQCKYSALVSLDPTVPYSDEDIAARKSIALENTNPNSAAMSLKLFNLAVAANQMAGIADEDAYAKSEFAKGPVKLYFRAVCEIPGIEGSRIVSNNVVSYDKVNVIFALLKPGWIYICGDVSTLDGSASNGFLDPSAANFDAYVPFRVYEPDDLAGQKLYVGHFLLNPKDNGGDTSNPDNASQFRFFTELLGWKPDASLGSHTNDFYVVPITDNVANGGTFNGEIISPGLGNWGIHCTEQTPFTVVVDVTGLNIYVVEGNKEVTFVGRTPQFN